MLAYVRNRLCMGDPVLPRFIREKECRLITGLIPMTRYRMEAKGQFPARRKLGSKMIGWLSTDIEKWIAQREKLDCDKANDFTPET